MKIKKSFIKLSATVPNVLLLLSILTSSVFFPATVIAQEIDQLPETEVVVDIPLDESEDILEEGIATGPVEEVLGTRDDIKPPLEKKKALDPSLEAPTNLGWNIRSKSLNTPGERPVDIACGGTTNADYYTYGDGKISHNWELSNAPVNALYQREWKTPGSGTWTTDGYAYTNDHTDFSTFGSSEGTEGEWNTRVRAWIDIDGNGLLDESIDEYSHWSNDCQVTYDRTRPAITLDLPLQDSLHSGTVGLQATGTEELDYINFWWKAEGEDYSNTAPHRRYHYIYDNGIQFKWSLDTLHAEMWGNDGTYHMTDGDYYFYAAGKDVAGNWARTDEIKIIVDNTPPDAPHLITPLNNSFVNGSSLTSQWSPISDADYYIYESYHDAGATDLRYHNTYTSTSKTATNVANAIFWWRVKSVDEAGNESDWSDLWKVTIDNDAPEVEITSHNDGDIVNGLQKISSKVFDVNLSHYWFVIEDSSGTTVAGPGPVHNDGPVVLPTFDWDTTGVDDGIYTIKLEARDKAGNKDPNQASVPADPGVENDSVDWVELTVDNTAPESTFDPNISGQTFNSLIKISGYSDDKFSHIVGVNLYYSPSGEDEWELIDKIENTTHSITPTLFRWSYAWTPTKDGTYDIKASAYDELGNEESSPIMTNITFDSTAPNVGPIRIVRDYAGLYINGWTGFTGSAKVTDSLSLVNTNSCEYMRDGTNWLKGDYTPWNSRCNFYIMGRLDDAEVLDMNVRVSDNAGNRGEGTQIARTADSQLPSVDVDIPNLFYGPKTFEASSTIQGSASDTVSKVRLVRVSLQRSDDGKYWRRTWNPYSSYAWRKGPQPRNNVLGTESWTYAGIFPTTFKNGETYTVTPYAWDQVHKKPGIGQSDSFIWDSQLPQDPTPSSSSHEVNSYSKDNTIEIAFSGAHDHGGSGIKGYYYSFSSSQEPPAINPSNWLDASISNTTSTPLADGEWWFNIRTVDNVNNITSTEHLGPFNIDTIPADIIWDTPLDGSIHNEPVILSVHTNETMNNLRFKWKKEGGSWDSGQNINIEDTSYAYVFNPLEDGVYTLRAQGRDLALNWSRADDITITIDRIDPDSPTNTGFNSRVPDYAQEPTEIACGGATNLNQVSHHWSIIDDAVNYQRQWVYPGDDPNIEGNWHGSEQWTTNYTNYRTFGGASGTQGLWHVRVKAQDLAGNWSEYSDACAITFDQTPPATPTGLQRLSRYDHSIIFACEDTVPIQSMHPDWDDNTEDDLSHYEYTSFDAPNGSVGTRRVFEESIFEYNGPWMPGEGTYGFVVRAVDNAGNKSAWALGGEETFEGSCQITYDDTAPTIVQDPAEEVIFLNEGDDIPEVIANFYDNYELSEVHYNLVNTEIGLDISDTLPIAGAADSLNLSEIAKGLALLQFSEIVLTIDTYYFPEGTYILTYSAEDLAGNVSEEKTLTVHVQNVAPTVDSFTSDTISITEGETVNFEAVFSDPAYIEYLSGEEHADDAPWMYSFLPEGVGTTSFDDTINIPEETLTFAHTYINEGTYFAQFKVCELDTDPGEGECTTDKIEITVSNNEPTITIQGTDTVVEGDDPITLTTTLTNGNAPFTYLWSEDCTGTTDTTTFDPTTEGEYTCTVTVTDTDGDIGTDSFDITVEAPPEGDVAGTGDYRYYADGTGSGDALLADSYVPDDEVLGEDDDVQGLLDRINSCETTKKLHGYLYIDKNKNGEKEDNEKLLADVSLKIFIPYNGNEITVKEITTDQDGYWETYLCPGDYNISVDQEDLPNNIDVEEVLSVTVSEDDDETQFNIAGIDSRNFWQKYWYIILIVLALATTTTYVILSNRRKEI